MSTKSKRISNCQEPSKYSEDFYYERASQKLDFDSTTFPNKYGEKLESVFKAAFKPITASRSDEFFMNEVFVCPKYASKIATKRIDEVSRDFFRSSSVSKFKELIGDYITRFADRIISDALLTQKNTRQNGIDRMYLLLGEKGCGKTTTINFLFLKKRIELSNNKIIWIRNSVYFRDRPGSREDIEKNFFSHFIDIINEYYKDDLKLNDIEVQMHIWRDKLSMFSNHDLCHTTETDKRIKGYIDKDKSEYAELLIKHAKEKGYSFVFVLDNIDQYESSNDMVKNIIDFAVKLTDKPEKSLVILVSRIDTINDCIEYFRDVFQNIDDNLYSIHAPDFREVFSKRLSYIEKYISDNSELKKIHIDGISWRVSRGYVARNIAKYFLTTIKDINNQDQYIISELSNHNIRDMFKMIKSILSTHIADVTDNPIEKIRDATSHGKEKEIEFEENTIRRHLIVWSLMLKNNHLYYKDEEARTWISNIYNTKHKEDSFFLKRVLIDFFIFMLKERNNEIINIDQIYQVFSREMLFCKEQIDNCVNELSSRLRNGQLIYFEKSRGGYRLTPKGFLFGDYIVNLFTYYELIIEDTLVPTRYKSEYSVDISLLPFEPLVYSDKRKQRESHIRYFNEKSGQVNKFLSFLECREILEKEAHNNFTSKSTGFSVYYFPKLYSVIEEQRKKIACALLSMG